MAMELCSDREYEVVLTGQRSWVMQYLVSGDRLSAIVQRWIGGEKADFWQKTK